MEVRGCSVWLLHEGLNRPHRCTVEFFAGTNIAVARDGTCGLDAKGHEPSLSRDQSRASTDREIPQAYE
jgi:hypothetical protein